MPSEQLIGKSEKIHSVKRFIIGDVYEQTGNSLSSKILPFAITYIPSWAENFFIFVEKKFCSKS